MMPNQRNKGLGLWALALILLTGVPWGCAGGDSGAGEEKLKILGPVTEDLEGQPVYHEMGDFQFMSHLGHPVNQDSFAGKITVVDVFFTTCTGICPSLSRSLATVQEEFKGDPHIQILSITVDPETDTLQALQDYAARYNALPGKWYFVTGDKKELYDFAKGRFFFKAMEDDSQEGELAFIHDKEMRLIDPEGRMRGDFHYDGTSEESVQQLIEDIKTLRREYFSE